MLLTGPLKVIAATQSVWHIFDVLCDTIPSRCDTISTDKGNIHLVMGVATTVVAKLAALTLAVQQVEPKSLGIVHRL